MLSSRGVGVAEVGDALARLGTSLVRSALHGSLICEWANSSVAPTMTAAAATMTAAHCHGSLGRSATTCSPCTSDAARRGKVDEALILGVGAKQRAIADRVDEPRDSTRQPMHLAGRSFGEHFLL